MKQHFLKHCEKSAEHHVALGKIHARLHKAHAAMGDLDVAEAHREAGSAHTARAEHFLELHKAIAEARDDIDTAHPTRITDRGEGGDLDGARKAAMGNPWGDRAHKIMPTGVQSVIPEPPGAGLRLIPRAGGPEVPTKQVDPALRDLVE